MGSCGISCIGMAVMADIGPFGDHGSCYRQPGGLIVLVPLAQSLYCCNHKYSNDNHKYQGKHDFKTASPEKGIHVQTYPPLFSVVYPNIITDAALFMDIHTGFPQTAAALFSALARYRAWSACYCQWPYPDRSGACNNRSPVNLFHYTLQAYLNTISYKGRLPKLIRRLKFFRWKCTDALTAATEYKRGILTENSYLHPASVHMISSPQNISFSQIYII